MFFVVQLFCFLCVYIIIEGGRLGERNGESNTNKNYIVKLRIKEAQEEAKQEEKERELEGKELELQRQRAQMEKASNRQAQVLPTTSTNNTNNGILLVFPVFVFWLDLYLSFK